MAARLLAALASGLPGARAIGGLQRGGGGHWVAFLAPSPVRCSPPPRPRPSADSSCWGLTPWPSQAPFRPSARSAWPGLRGLPVPGCLGLLGLRSGGAHVGGRVSCGLRRFCRRRRLDKERLAHHPAGGCGRGSRIGHLLRLCLAGRRGGVRGRRRGASRPRRGSSPTRLKTHLAVALRWNAVCA